MIYCDDCVTICSDFCNEEIRVYDTFSYASLQSCPIRIMIIFLNYSV